MSLCTMKGQDISTKTSDMHFLRWGKKSFAIPLHQMAEGNNRGLVLGKRVCGFIIRKPFFKNLTISYHLNLKLAICISILMQLLLAGLKTAAQNHTQAGFYHNKVSHRGHETNLYYF